LDEDSKLGAYILYRWCRHCDDVIDTASTKDVAEVLAGLYQQTENALSGTLFQDDSSFSGLYQLSLKYNISKHYFLNYLKVSKWT